MVFVKSFKLLEREHCINYKTVHLILIIFSNPFPVITELCLQNLSN